jgi:hypothetical protein
MKEFIIQTLVDITETGQKRKEPGLEIDYGQHQNFTMLMQTIGMRVNPLYTGQPRVRSDNVDGYGFGSVYTGNHNIWTFKFSIEYADGYTDAMGNSAGLLIDDLNFIPMIVQLTETAELDRALLDTKSPQYKNTIVFATDDE